MCKFRRNFNKYVGIFVIRRNKELYWRGKLFTLEEALRDSKKSEYSHSILINYTLQEEITLFTINTYVCDRKNSIFYLKEVRMLGNPEEIILSMDIGERVFRNFEEVNKKFFIC